MPARTPERIQYASTRDMPWMRSPPSAPPNFWSIQYDRRAWDARGRNFTLYKSERTYASGQKPSVHTEIVHADAGPKMSVAHKVYRSPMRYGAMRDGSSNRTDPSKQNLSGTDGEVVGPGKYDPRVPSEIGTRPAFSIDGSSAFASGTLRIPPTSFSLPHRTSEPAFSSVAQDNSAWNKHENGQKKGASFSCTQRFQRRAGPGSNPAAGCQTHSPSGPYASCCPGSSPRGSCGFKGQDNALEGEDS